MPAFTSAGPACPWPRHEIGVPIGDICARPINHVAMLSHASLITRELQGGPMPRNEWLQFEIERYSHGAIRLRRWDDPGKMVGLKTPGLAEYRELIEELALRD